MPASMIARPTRPRAAAAVRPGLAPRALRAACEDATMRVVLGECWLGSVLVAVTARGIGAMLLGDDPGALARDLQDRFPQAAIIDGDADCHALGAAAIGLIEEPRRDVVLPLDVRGSVFQQRVWDALRAVPAGSTATYAEIAAALGQPRACRAVARACAANPVAVAIPCHRVIHSDGSVSGYRWGVARKRALLAREAGERVQGWGA